MSIRSLSAICLTGLALGACGGPTTEASEMPSTAAQPAGPGSANDSTAPAPTNPAPEFSLKDLDGTEWTLSAQRGKTVVLEWFNPGCPFVKYAHGEGPLKDMAKKEMERGVVWWSINSGAPGKQGHGVETNLKARKEWAMAGPILLDESGGVGQLYQAKTTPNMVVIDTAGSIVYRGALDNAPLGKAPGEGYVNYVEAALAALAAGEPIEVAETQSYGCSVKYAE